MSPRVAIAVLEGAPLFEIAVPCEVFGIARPDLIAPAYEVVLCGVGPGPTRTGAGLVADGQHDMDDFAEADTLIVPALPRFDSQVPPELVRALRIGKDRGARIVAICTGAFALAEAGLLDGRRATTHWMYAANLAERFPAVRVEADVLYITDEAICTSAGTAAGIDLCLELVRSDHGAAVAAELARRLVVPPHRQGGQAQYVSTPLPESADASIGPVMEWALARLDQPLTLADLAGVAHISERTLARRFIATLGQAPMRWIIQQRVRHAQQLLETTDASIERIARLSGMGSPTNLRTHFIRQSGTTPTAYRRAFGVTDAAGAAGATAGR